ncbi:MFS transporter [Flavitalea antarctica]
MNKNNFYKWELLIWLWLAFFFNQADRQIFNVVLPSIKTSLGLTDAQLGMVASLFVLTVGVFIPIAGFVGDLFSRKKIIVFSLLFWSIATALTGTSNSLLALILFRSIAVGGGEAFYAPAANSLIGQYHQKTRAMAMSIHQTSLYFGVILSGWLGGYIGEHYGWKTTFYLFGGVGIILSLLLAFRLQKTTKAISNLTAEEQKGFIKKAFLAIAKNPTALLLIVAFACMVFVNVSYLTWMPTFLHEKFGLSLTNAGFSSMFYHHIFAFAGVVFGGWLSDRVALKRPNNRFFVQAFGLLLGAPFIYLMGQADSTIATYIFLGGFGFFRGVYDANIYTTLFEVIQPAYRATAAGLSAMFAFIVAAIAPFLLGYLKPTLGLSNGLSSLSVVYLLGGISILIAVLKFFSNNINLKQVDHKDYLVGAK